MNRCFVLRAMMLATAGVPMAASAQTTDKPAASNDVGAEVVVTGSRGLPRTVTDSPVPIDVIQAADLEKTGKTGVLSALNTLVPSFNMPNRAGGSTASIISTGGLRGLNPDQTLILVNGKRRHKSSLINAVSSAYNGSVPADLDLIPVAAVDHIEVLRDGAAAKYGSDAIAGVINIILKKGAEGSAAFTAGQNMDRSDGETYQAEIHGGVKLGERGFVNLTVQAKRQYSSNRALPVPIGPGTYIYPLVNGQPDPREATSDRLVTKNYGAFPQRTVNSAYNAAYDVGGGVELYSFGTYSQRRSDLNVTFRAPNNAAAIPQVYPNGYRPDEVIRETDFEFAFGARGKLSGWDFDVSTTYGSNRARLNNIGSINASLGPSSPTSFYLGTLRSSEWVNSLDLTRGFDVGGNLQVSAGLQHRLETYSISAGDPASYAASNYIAPGGKLPLAPGAQGASGITPADAGRIHRNNLSAYLDLAYDPTPSLTFNVAGRFEHFDDASGNTVNGEASGRYAVTPWLSIRGAASTGFRAPALAQQIFASTTGQFRLLNGQTVLLSIKTLPVGSPAAIALGATPLKPEKSTNFSGGIVLQPAAGLNITIDAYQISVRDRIAITGTLTGAAVSTILVANGLSPDISAQYFTNAIDTRTTGIDVVSTYRLALGSFGSMRLNASYNYNHTKITHVIANPAQLSALGPSYVLFDRLTRGNIENLLPRSKLLLSDVWTIGDFSLSLREVRYGAYTIPQLLAANDRRFGAKWITDVEASWQATRQINLAVGANNVFNTYPDANGIFNVPLGSQQYGGSPPSPFGFTGGFYYGRVSVSF